MEQPLLGAAAPRPGSGRTPAPRGGAKAPEAAARGGGARSSPEAPAARGGPAARGEGPGGPPGLVQRVVEAVQDLCSPVGLVLREDRAHLSGIGGESPQAAASRQHEHEALLAMPTAPLVSVMAAMSRYDGSDMAEAGCRRLCELQAQQEEGLLAAGAAELVLRAMERHKGDRSLGIQEAGVRFLRDAASSREGQAKVAAAGGCHAVLRAMSGRAASGSPRMQELGCGAVLNLARDHSEGGSKGHAAWKVGMEGGVGAVLQAMTACEDSPQVQQAACAALRALLLDPSSQAKVVAGDGIQALLLATTVHAADAAVVAAACSALLLLARAYPDSLPQMAAAGAAAAAARCLSDHAADAAARAASRSLLDLLGAAHGPAPRAAP
ncbi:unnamed protein product [Prorocentrum cordatum]|uniref:Armadillo repeat-containing protein 8 n=1 Tax=Prorocentrum cordatum TaxID=2364126 RepID=A0ABN9WC15_9DINO|nr:unnamed protein product [Polarella glacialis]